MLISGDVVNWVLHLDIVGRPGRSYTVSDQLCWVRICLL